MKPKNIDFYITFSFQLKSDNNRSLIRTFYTIFNVKETF